MPKKRELRERKTEKRDKEIKLCFWNIAGLVNKCEEMWDYLEKFDIVRLTET